MLAAAVLALSVVVVVPGCGGGDSTSSLTKAEFIKRASAICTAGVKNVETAVVKFSEEPKTGSEKVRIEKYMTTGVVPAYSASAEKLKALGAPEGDEAKVDAIVAALEKGIDEVEADPYKAFSELSHFAEFAKLTKAYGVKDCGEF